MDEKIFAAVVGLDEPVPLVVAEPFHGSVGHRCSPSLCAAYEESF
jgi:hypothetical protein